MLRTPSPTDFHPSLEHTIRKLKSSATLILEARSFSCTPPVRGPPRPRSVPPRSSSRQATKKPSQPRKRLDEIALRAAYLEDQHKELPKQKPTHLNVPDNAVFPDPPRHTGGLSTPLCPATPAADPFPFPFRPSASPLIGNGRNLRKPRPRAVSFGGSLPIPPRTPDRFIPARDSFSTSSGNYRLSKPASQLSPTERLLRDHTASHDPFRQRRRTPLPPRRRNNDNIPSPPPTPDRMLLPRRWTTGNTNRTPSNGAVWNVGGTAASTPSPTAGIDNGRGGLLSSGSNAPMYSSSFFASETADQSLERFEGRLAAAFDIDQTSKVLSFSSDNVRQRSLSAGSKLNETHQSTVWKDGIWYNEKKGTFLDAPSLRDDFYCSVLAYSPNSRTIAVGLNNRVYLWSERGGVRYPQRDIDRDTTVYVTSLSFSSKDGGFNILATGRSNGSVELWDIWDQRERLQAKQTKPIACLAFKPVPTKRKSDISGAAITTEELLVGDEGGMIHYYAIEWGVHTGASREGRASLQLLAKIDIHTQQICGIAWSADGEYFATGGNDNLCLLYSTYDILSSPDDPQQAPFPTPITGFIPEFVPNAESHVTFSNLMEASGNRQPIASRHSFFPHTPLSSLNPRVLRITAGRERHRWVHSAAVKAIAFCPWQRGLIATGGGSNDRAIHFYHTWSGACLATINVHAQVTTLIWSKTRREIAATFGYAQPEHPYRIAVFSWPDCKQVLAIPWAGEMRALYAIPYPGGPSESPPRHRTEGGRWWSRTAEEGCIVVACSDESVKFHEVWNETGRGKGGGVGGLGFSEILESLEGIDREGDEIIR